MSTLAHINLAHTENAPQNTVAQQMSDIAVQEAVSPQHKYVIFKLVNTKSGPVNVDGIDEAYNPKTKSWERIYLISGAQSIWQSELTELLKDKQYVELNRKSLRFERGGVLRVLEEEENTLAFIRNCRHLIDNPKRKSGSRTEFFEYNPQKQQEAALEKEMLELDMAIAAKEQPEDAMLKHANYLGIVFFDELGEKKSPAGIRKEYMLAAKRNPVHFKKTLGSKEVDITFLVKRAILDAKIDLGKTGSAYWAANGGFIAKIPQSRKALDYLVEFAMTNSTEGKQFLSQLNDVIK